MPVSRISVSLETNMLEELDLYVKDNNFSNRSQAIRQIVERNLVERKWQCNHIVAGAITLLYSHDKRELGRKIADIQHNFHHHILAVQHFHLSHHLCLEIVAVQGPAGELTKLADELIAVKGVLHGKLAMSRSDGDN